MAGTKLARRCGEAVGPCHASEANRIGFRDLAHTPVWVMNLVLKYPSIASVPPSEP